MSLLDGNNENVFDIELFYKFKKIGTGKKLLVIEDEKAKKLMAEEKGKDIEKLVTKWRFLSWKEQNEVMAIASQAINPQTGEKQFNFLMYRDAIIKRCLRGWDITVNEQPVPVTPEAIDQLPGPVVMSLYQKFETIIDYTEDEVGN